MRLYLVGAGVIAREHAKAARTAWPDVQIHVFDPNPTAAKQFATDDPDCVVASSLDDLLKAPAKADDVVVIATPPFAHREPALVALGSGRHVLCEKPLALNTEQAVDMLTAARRARRHLGCCSTRFIGRRTQARVIELLSCGSLGRVYKLTHMDRQQRGRSGVEYQPQSTWFHDPAKNGGGVLMDWGPYDFALFWELLRPTRVDVLHATIATCRTAADPFTLVTEQHVIAALRAWPGIDLPPITIEYERAACTHGGPRRVSEVEGTEGAVRWDWLDWEGDTVTIAHDVDGRVRETQESHPTAQNNCHARPLLHFVQKVRGEQSPAIVDGVAAFNFAAMRAIYEAAQCQQAVRIDRATFQTDVHP